MGRNLAVVVGVVMLLVGGLWTFQGLGYIGGSVMSGSTTWAIIGPVVAGLGVALVIVGVQRRE
ncbi:hypothetical protein [Nocardioides sp. GXQ0305]|uniref:hypothetical protein n=1 Tax=Nocardioides sp. GXQ0305 TaxID=3423912 RepID=UPI003D7F0564